MITRREKEQILIARSPPSSSSRRSRSNTVPHGGAPQQRRPVVGVRQASIGIRRMPSSNALRSVAQQPNPSTQRLSTPLPALDENCALEQIPTKSSQSTAPKGEPSRLTKVKSALQTRVPFWGNKEKQKIPDNHVAPAQQTDAYSMDYTSDMVDVLDTLGMCQTMTSTISQANKGRS